MSVVIHSDVGGHTVTANINGAKLVMDLETAHQVSHFIAVALDKIYQDQTAAHQRDALYLEINGRMAA